VSAVAASAAAALFLVTRPLDSPSPAKWSSPAAEFPPARGDQTIPAAPVPERGQPAIPETMEELLANAEPKLRDLILEKSLPQLIVRDAHAAARFAERQRDPFLREAALRVVATDWARLAPEAASQWAVSLGNEVERDQAIEHVAFELAASDTRGALNLLERRSRGNQADVATAGVIASWANLDFDGAVAWAEAQPPSPALDEILQRLVFLKANTDPLKATQLAERMVTDETVRSDVFASIAQVWAARDPDAAREWAASLDTNVRRRVEGELALWERSVTPTN
jgi:hypothetical protein